jgi:hypothetical protein
MSKKTNGIKIPLENPAYLERCIVIDDKGVPWVIDPAKGTITLAQIRVPAVK